MPVEASPSIILLCVNRNTMIIGNIAKTLVAIATPVAAAAACESVNLVSPIVTVHHFCASPEKISCGQLSEFHEPVKALW